MHKREIYKICTEKNIHRPSRQGRTKAKEEKKESAMVGIRRDEALRPSLAQSASAVSEYLFAFYKCNYPRKDITKYALIYLYSNK